MAVFRSTTSQAMPRMINLRQRLGALALLQSYIKPYKNRLISGILCSALAGLLQGMALGLVTFEVWGKVFGKKLVPGSLSFYHLLAYSAAIPLAFLLAGFTRYLATYLMNWVGLRTIRDIRIHLFSRFQFQSLSFFQKHKTGDLISRMTTDTVAVQSAIVIVIADLIRCPIQILAGTCYMFWMDWKLALFLGCTLPTCILPIRYFGNKVRNASRKAQENQSEILSFLHENFTAPRVIRAFRLEDWENNRFTEISRRQFHQFMRIIRSQEIVSPLIEITASLGFAIALIYIYLMKIEIEKLLSIAVVANSIYAATKNLSKINLTINQSSAAAERLVEHLHSQSTVQEVAQPIPLRRIREKIEFDHVTFAYEEKPVLHDLSFHIAAGDKVALVGRSGSGKSTIINLLLRFYDPQQGEIRIDGIPLTQVSFADLRDQVGLVSQEIVLFNDTVAANIGLGKLGSSREEIVEAARRAYADEFIRALPQGYETIIGEKGTRLSGGQRQRLAIARAFIRNPAILILDEATSSLDSESERLVMKAFDELMSGRTAIVIAHRLSTIQNADRIMVLQEGHLVETGPHFELLARNGVYKRLHDQQVLTHLDERKNLAEPFLSP